MAKYKIMDFNKGNPITYIFNSKEDAEKSYVCMFDKREIKEVTEEDEKQLHKIYIAAPLFTDVQKRRINEVVTWLRSLGNEVYSPMEYTVENAWGISNPEWAQKVYMHDLEDLEKADTVVCLYDGMDSDTGTAWELGYAHAKGKIVVTICNEIKSKQSLMVINGSNLVCGMDTWKDAWLDFARNPTKYVACTETFMYKVNVPSGIVETTVIPDDIYVKFTYADGLDDQS